MSFLASSTFLAQALSITCAIALVLQVVAKFTSRARFVARGVVGQSVKLERGLHATDA